MRRTHHLYDLLYSLMYNMLQFSMHIMGCGACAYQYIHYSGSANALGIFFFFFFFFLGGWVLLMMCVHVLGVGM